MTGDSGLSLQSGRALVAPAVGQNCSLWMCEPPTDGGWTCAATAMKAQYGRWLSVQMALAGTGSQDTTARLWDLRAADPLQRARLRVMRIGHCPGFQPGRALAGHRQQRSDPRLWDMRSADPTANPIELKGHLDSVAALAFSPMDVGCTGSWDKTSVCGTCTRPTPLRSRI